MRILELMEAAHNCVSGMMNVQKGENVLVLTDTSGFADPLVTEAIALAAKEAGADVTIATSREFEPRLEEPPKIIQNAFYAANSVLVISTHEATLHCRTARRAMLEFGTKFIAVVGNTAELMSSEWARFPMEVYWAIANKVFDQVSSGKTIRVTSPGGTDISAGVHPSHVMGFPQSVEGRPHPPAKGDAMYTMFPTGVFGVHPLDPANGVIVYDALLGIKGWLKEPVRVTMEDHWVKKIEGGEEARWFRNLIEERKKDGAESDYWSEIMWGLNPKASIERGLTMIHLRESELTRRAGTLHFGIGKGAKGFHWDGILLRPFSVYVDGLPVIEKGRLTALDDPEIRKIASQYGNPDKLLAETP